MSDPGHTSSTRVDASQTSTFGQRLLPICYFGAVAVAMAGWVWAIGWVVLTTANWLFA